MCSACHSIRQKCDCRCEMDDIILAAIGQPFCMVCEHQLKRNHNEQTPGAHPILQRRAMAADAAAFAQQGITPSPAAPQPVYSMEQWEKEYVTEAMRMWKEVAKQGM